MIYSIKTDHANYNSMYPANAFISKVNYDNGIKSCLIINEAYIGYSFKNRFKYCISLVKINDEYDCLLSTDKLFYEIAEEINKKSHLICRSFTNNEARSIFYADDLKIIEHVECLMSSFNFPDRIRLDYVEDENWGFYELLRDGNKTEISSNGKTISLYGQRVNDNKMAAL